MPEVKAGGSGGAFQQQGIQPIAFHVHFCRMVSDFETSPAGAATALIRQTSPAHRGIQWLLRK
jgi:hypothetical protein